MNLINNIINNKMPQINISLLELRVILQKGGRTNMKLKFIPKPKLIRATKYDWEMIIGEIRKIRFNINLLEITEIFNPMLFYRALREELRKRKMKDMYAVSKSRDRIIVVRLDTFPS